MSRINTSRYQDYITATQPTAEGSRTPLEIGTSGQLDYKRDPGYWQTIWDSQVSSTINQTLVGRAISMVTSPIQSYQGYYAPDSIHEGLMRTYDNLAGREDITTSTLRKIEEDPNATGQDWWNAYPSEVKQKMKELGIEEPSKFNDSAAEFAKDWKTFAAGMVYNTKISEGYEKFNDFGLLVGNLAVGAVTDPTNLALLGYGSVVKQSAQQAAKISLGKTLVKAAGLQFSLGAVATADRMVAASNLAEEIGVNTGRIVDPMDLLKEPLKEGAISAAIGTAFLLGGYAASQGAAKASKYITSAKALDLANRIHDESPLLSEAQLADLTKHVNDSTLDKADLPVQMSVLNSVMENLYGVNSKIPEDAWSMDWLTRFGVSPVEIARKFLREGYSGRQAADFISSVTNIISDAEDLVTRSQPFGSATPLNVVTDRPTEVLTEMAAPPKPTLVPKPEIPKKEYSTPVIQKPMKLKDVVESPDLVPVADPVVPKIVDTTTKVSNTQLANLVDAATYVAEKNPDLFKLLQNINDNRLNPLGRIADQHVKSTIKELQKFGEEVTGGLISVIRQGKKVGTEFAKVITRAAEAYQKTAGGGAAIETGLKQLTHEDFLAEYRKAFGIPENGKPNVIRFDAKKFTKRNIEFHDMLDALAWQTTFISSKDKIKAMSGPAFEMVKKYFGVDPAALMQRRRDLKEIITKFDAARTEAIDPTTGEIFKTDGKARAGSRTRVLRDEKGVVKVEYLQRQHTLADLRKAQSAVNKTISEAPKPTKEVTNAFVIGMAEAARARIEAQNKAAIAKYQAMSEHVDYYNKQVRELQATKAKAAKQYSEQVYGFWQALKQGAENVRDRFGHYGMTIAESQDYMYKVASGDYEGAHKLITDRIGPGKFEEITKAAAAIDQSKKMLRSALKMGDRSIINSAKELYDKNTSYMRKLKMDLFEPSPTKVGSVDLGKPLIAEGPVSRRYAGTPMNPSTTMYSEAPGNTGSHTMPSEINLILDRVFMDLPSDTLAKLIHTDVGSGAFARLANGIKVIEGGLTLSSDAARLITTEVPMLGELLNLVAPVRLRKSSAFGNNKMTPSLEGQKLKMNAESNLVMKTVIDVAKKYGISQGDDSWNAAIIAAKREHAIGTTENLPKDIRALADSYRNEYLKKYMSKSSEEGLMAGKIRQKDDHYVRVVLKDTSIRNMAALRQVFHEAYVEFFSDPKSPVHMATLTSIENKPYDYATLADLQAGEPGIVGKYLAALKDPNGLLEKKAAQEIQIRQGINVLDDDKVVREASYYMNAGLGKKIDEKILLSKGMQEFIETDLAKNMHEYNRNVRYYFLEQLAVDNWLSTNFNTSVKGIPFNQLMSYCEALLTDKLPGQTKEIKEVFKSLSNKRAQLTHRLGRSDEAPLFDAAIAIVTAPLRTAVTGGIAVTSGLTETARAAAVAARAIFSFGANGPDGFFENIRTAMGQLTKVEIEACQHAMHDANVHTDLHEIDAGSFRYAGGFWPTKWNIIKESFKDIGRAATSDKDASHKFRDTTVAAMNLPNEIVRQAAFTDSIAKLSANIHHAAARIEFSQYLMDALAKKSLPANEITSRMEHYGLFSKEALDAVRKIQAVNPDIFKRTFSVAELNSAIMKTHGVSDSLTSQSLDLFSRVWHEAIESHVDARVMTVPRVMDLANPGASPGLNRLLNLFATYSRWWFNRNALQVFPSSSAWRVGSYVAWFSMAEATSMMMRDALRNPEEVANMDGEDMAIKYGVGGLLNVPYFGQVTRHGVSVLAMLNDDVFGNKTTLPVSRGMDFMKWKSTATEGVKLLKGDNGDYRKFIRGVPMFNAPLFEGLTARYVEKK